MTDKIGLTIEEAADYTGIGRNTMRKLVEWEKIPVLRIGRRYIIRIDSWKPTRVQIFWCGNRSVRSDEGQDSAELFICRFVCGLL